MSAPTLRSGPVEWFGLVLVALCGALAGLLEVLLVPLYAGGVIVPVAVVLSLLSNFALPRLAHTLRPTAPAALAPFLLWLVVVIGFGVVTRPEGDVILPGAPNTVVYVVYGMLLGGALVGTVTVVMSSPAPAKRRSS